MSKLEVKIERSIKAVNAFEDKLNRCEKFIKEDLESANVSTVKLYLESVQTELETYFHMDDFLTANDENHATNRVELHHRAIVIQGEMMERISQTKGKIEETLKITATQAKLPKLDLPVFDGDMLKWRAFRDSFVSLISTHTGIDESVKFLYLKNSLKNQAAELIRSLEGLDNAFTIAFNLLEERYDNKRLIIEQHINQLFLLKKIDVATSVNINQLLDNVNMNLRALKSLGRPVDSWDDLLVHLVTSRLDTVTRSKFIEEVKSKEPVSLRVLLEFLKSRVQFLIHSSSPSSSQVNKKQVLTLKSNTRTCTFCQGDHSLHLCASFAKESIKARREFVKRESLCFNCLRKNHRLNQCTITNTCRTCNKRHHSLLHLEPVLPLEVEIEETVGATALQVHSVGNSTVFLGTAKIWVQNNNGKWINACVLLDSGSQMNLITESFASKLNLSKFRSEINISGIGPSTLNTNMAINIRISNNNKTFFTHFTTQIVPFISQKQDNSFIDVNNWKLPQHIALADPDFTKPNPIDILIGAEQFMECLNADKIRLGKNMPYIQDTKLGWIVLGKFIQKQPTNLSCLVGAKTELPKIEDQLEKFWKLEECDDSNDIKIHNEITEQAETHFLDTHSRDDSGRFVVRLPFRDSSLQLGQSQEMAKRRFVSLERRLNANPDLKTKYTEFIDEYIKLGHMIQEKETSPDIGYYLPHHCVFKETSSTTKLRVVFDGSAKSSKGISLNDNLIVGPVVQNSLYSILLLFRAYKYVFSADIEKMYRQINIHPNDQIYQRIFWRRGDDQPISTYKLTTVTYGTSSAPYLATRCLHELSKHHTTQYPKACQALVDNTYVDDVFAGSDTIDEIFELKAELVKLLNCGQFHLRKWISNLGEILQNIPMEDREKLISLPSGEFAKALGIAWSPVSDELSFEFIQPNTSTITKRRIISDISKIFDPLGLISPVVIRGKILLQDLWKLNLSWDDVLPEAIQRQWNDYKQQLQLLPTWKIQRHIFDGSVKDENVILHGFCDASMKAYGAVIYAEYDTGASTKLSLITAKSRVAPTKTQTLPRLELCGAVLLIKLMKTVATTYKITQEKLVYHTDSQIVLCWIGNSPSRWKTFVANRVSEIQKQSTIENWRYIKSQDNPADLVSRGISVQKFLSSDLWKNGPTSVLNFATQMPSFEIDIPEERHLIHNTTIVDDWVFGIIKPSIANSFRSLQRTLGWMHRFVFNCKNKSNRRSGPLTIDEINHGLTTIMKSIQGAYFTEELAILKSKQEIYKGQLKSFSPFIDESGLIRVGGRLKNSKLPFNEKHPVLIPKNHQFGTSISKYYHNKFHHCGPQATLALTRDQFWIVNGKSVCTRVVKSCMICFRTNPRRSQPKFGDLPEVRTAIAHPFSNVGVDFCGPFKIYIRRRGSPPTKGYGCVFVCLATKAVHLELVSDLTSQAFLGAFRRFCATRGLASNVYSDNGTNFVGAERELKNVLDSIRTCNQELGIFCDDNNIHWHFSPPRAPHFGGIFEAAVKSTKHHLRRIVGDAHLTFEELQTVLKAVEAVLNSRPIVPLSSSPNDMQALTPGHFLIGRPLCSLPIKPSSLTNSVSYLQRWKLVEQLIAHFWSRWSKEYLRAQQQRNKWLKSSRELTQGQMVIVAEDGLPPLQWQLGRIVDVFPGRDGIVRVVSVRTSSGIKTRPAIALCPLPDPS